MMKPLADTWFRDAELERAFVAQQQQFPHRRNGAALLIAAAFFMLGCVFFGYLTPLALGMRGVVSGASVLLGILLLSKRTGQSRYLQGRWTELWMMGFVAAPSAVVVSTEFYILMTRPEWLYSGDITVAQSQVSKGGMLAGMTVCIFGGYMATTTRVRLAFPALLAASVVPFVVTRFSLCPDEPLPLFIARLLMLLLANAAGALARGSEELLQRTVFRQAHDISQQEEQARSTVQCVDSLLSAMLPPRVVQLLKLGLPVTDSFPMATVLYTDVVDFTRWASQHSPVTVVSLLNEMFCTFDSLAAQAGHVEKIKTVGDAYWAVSGLVQNTIPTDAALAMLHFAFAVQDWARDYVRDPPLLLRIGIHSGPVIAGIAGRVKCSYDVFGATDAVAQQMEKTGQPGAVHFSQATKLLVGGHFRCVPMDVIYIEGIGRVPSFSALPCVCPRRSLNREASSPGNPEVALPLPSSFRSALDRTSTGYQSQVPVLNQPGMLSDMPDADSDGDSEKGDQSLVLPPRWRHLAFLDRRRGTGTSESSAEVPSIPTPIHEDPTTPLLDRTLWGQFKDRTTRLKFGIFQQERTTQTRGVVLAMALLINATLTLVYLLIDPILLIAPRGGALLATTAILILALVFRRDKPARAWLLVLVAAANIVATPFGQNPRHPALPPGVDMQELLANISRALVASWIATVSCCHHHHPASRLGLSLLVALSGLPNALQHGPIVFLCLLFLQLCFTASYSGIAHLAMITQFNNYLRLRQEQEKSQGDAAVYEALLLNLFPTSVIPRLLGLPVDAAEFACQPSPKSAFASVACATQALEAAADAGAPVIADNIPQLGVLFAVIDGLDAAFLLQHPKQAFRILDEIYAKMDSLTQTETSLEKIKSIGSTYMVVSGLPSLQQTNSLSCPYNVNGQPANVDALLRFAQHFMSAVTTAAAEVLSISNGAVHITPRVGLHVGPAVGAVIGRRLKLSYDVFGDTVNVASRISNSVTAASGVCCSRQAVELLRKIKSVSCESLRHEALLDLVPVEDKSKNDPPNLSFGLSAPVQLQTSSSGYVGHWHCSGPTQIVAKGKGTLDVYVVTP